MKFVGKGDDSGEGCRGEDKGAGEDLVGLRMGAEEDWMYGQWRIKIQGF